MKLKFLIICSFIILIIQQCKWQTNQKLNELNNFETLTQIFENENGFNEYCEQLDSIFYSLFFRVPCDIIDKLNKTRYNIIKAKADSFDLTVPQVNDGGFYFKCDPRLFEYLKFSCEYYGQSPEVRMKKIMESMVIYENSLDKKVIQSQNVLFRENMKLISEDSIINIYQKIKNNFYIQSKFISNLKFSKKFEEKYFDYFEYFLLINRDNYNNYKYILDYFLNINSKNKIEKNELLLKEKQFIFNSSHILDSNQIKLIEYIDHYISDVKK